MNFLFLTLLPLGAEKSSMLNSITCNRFEGLESELRKAFKICFKNVSLVSYKPSCSLALTKATEGKTCYN